MTETEYKKLYLTNFKNKTPEEISKRMRDYFSTYMAPRLKTKWKQVNPYEYSPSKDIKKSGDRNNDILDLFDGKLPV